SRQSGTLVSATSRTISFREGTTVHRYAHSMIQSIEFSNSTAASPGPEAGAARLPSRSRAPVVLPTGAEISVLTNQNIDSKTANEGQVFPADVAESVTNAAGHIVSPNRSEADRVTGRVARARTVTATLQLALDLQSIKVG